MSRVHCIGGALLLFLLTPPASSSMPLAGEEAIRRDLLAFTERSMDGLSPGTLGLDAAAGRIADRFREAGLRPAFGDTSWFQPVGAYRNVRAQGTNGLRGPRGSYRVLTEWRPLGFSTEGNVDQAPLLFAGFGLSLPSIGWDEYEEIDATGCVVLVLDEAPVEGRWTAGALRREKATWARRHDALGILFVTPRKAGGAPETGPLVAAGPGEVFIDCRILAGRLLQATADSLLAGSGFDIERPAAGEEWSVKRGRLPEVPVDWVVSLRRQKITLHNVAGILPGREPGWVLIQTPYQGRGGRPDPEEPNLQPCANDIGSGLAVLLDLSRRLGAVGSWGGRSLLFGATVLTEQEQMGAVGLATHLAMLAEPIAAVVAFERLGLTGEGPRAVAGPSQDLWKDLLEGRSPGVRFELPEALAGDATPLGRNGVAFLYLRGADDPLAATPDDMPTRLDVGGLSRVSVLLDALVRDLADPAVLP